MKKFIIVTVCICMLMSMLPCMSYAHEEAGRELIYVAPNGNDSADGSINSPLATLIGARNKIRELKRNGVNPPKGFVVYVRGGEYSISETLELTAEDSGREGAPVVYRGYPGEKATLIGGSTLPINKFQEVTDEAILERVVDKGARSKLLQIDLFDLGVKNIPSIDMNLRGQYSYEHKFLTEYDKPKGGAMELLFNGKPMNLSRYPNDGGIQIRGIETSGGLPATGNESEDAERLNKDPNARVTIEIDDSRINFWTKADEMAVSGNMTFEWADESIPIGIVDVEKKTLASTRMPYYVPGVNKYMYVYNLLEEIDIPGEYFIDSKKGILYFYPPSALGNATILLTVFDGYGIEFNGCSYVNVTNLEFTGFRNSAIFFTKGSHNLVSKCEVSYTATTAISFTGATYTGITSENYYCGVTDCYVHDVNHGINIDGGNYRTLEKGNNYAVNNHVERYSRLQTTYLSGVSLEGIGNRMEHNEIHDGPHTGTMWGGCLQTIKYNEFYDVCKVTGDMGAIYTGQNWMLRGNEIKYNYVHDIPKTGSQSTYGVYLDGGMSGTKVIGNVFENLNKAVYVNGGSDNIVLNNVMVNTDEGVRMSTAMVDAAAEGDGLYDRMVARGREFMELDIYRETFPEFAAQFAEGRKPEEPRGNIIQNNVAVGGEVMVYEAAAAAYASEKEITNNITSSKDPGFYDMAGRNYWFKEDAEVFKRVEGFKAVPFTRMGRFNERADIRVQEAVVLAVDNADALINGKQTMIDPDNRKVVPKIIDSTTFVPLRFIAEALGSNVEYNAETKEITISNNTTTLKLTLDSTKADKNGEAFELQKAPFVQEGRTLVPLREISNLFGKSVFWHNMGFIAISDNEQLFDEERGTDEELIAHLYNRLNQY